MANVLPSGDSAASPTGSAERRSSSVSLCESPPAAKATAAIRAKNVRMEVFSLKREAAGDLNDAGSAIVTARKASHRANLSKGSAGLRPIGRSQREIGVVQRVEEVGAEPEGL